ncbi:MAG: hypothetical protein HZC43_03980 [Nitrosomonadales bacterium]|nr:hypothetical protein [Nitrosomonadales bacterium]
MRQAATRMARGRRVSVWNLATIMLWIQVRGAAKVNNISCGGLWASVATVEQDKGVLANLFFKSTDEWFFHSGQF